MKSEIPMNDFETNAFQSLDGKLCPGQEEKINPKHAVSAMAMCIANLYLLRLFH